MAKRKKTDIVGLKVRLREALRKRIETAAKAHDQSLNSEINDRLEVSFESEAIWFLMEKLLAPGANLILLKQIAQILHFVGEDWYKRSDRHMVADAISKILAVFIGDRPSPPRPTDDDIRTADDLAWIGSVTLRATTHKKLEPLK